MDQTLLLWISIVVITTLGVLFHFLYDLGHENKILALFIPLVFYTYTRLSKKPILPVDILTFAVAIILAQLTFFFIINLTPHPYFVACLSCFGIFIILGSYMTLTVMPLKEVVFKDPITGEYGFSAHRNLLKSSKKKSSKK